jgi:hypothetical protein
MPATLLPVLEGVDADAHGLSELSLSEPDKAPQSWSVSSGTSVIGFHPCRSADEAILKLGVNHVIDFKVVGARREEFLSLLERDPMIPLVREVLGIIPANPHIGSIGQG